LNTSSACLSRGHLSQLPIALPATSSGEPLGALDWPPAAEIATGVRIYRFDDREKYRAGVQAPTEYVR
jgi:hypothetical protein